MGFFLRGRISTGLARALNRRATAVSRAPSLQDVLRSPWPTPLDLARLLTSRPNAERQALVGRYLDAAGVPHSTHGFRTFEGSGENFVVDVGEGERILVLLAHHDAVPGSPGANDNAAAVGILLHLLDLLRRDPPARLRVRLVFTAAEELGYLGARAYVKDVPLRDVAGAISLELCGIGDNLALWDAADATPLQSAFEEATEALGYRKDESYHVVGRIPVFGSDHRAFAAAGVPAYGLTVVPGAEAERLREFIFNPWRSAFRQLVRRPPPFETYHTSRDQLETLDAGALARVVAVLETLIRKF